MLDCQTPKGRKFISHQLRTQSLLEKKGYKFLNMASSDSAADVLIAKDVDGILTLCGVAEIKSREMAGNQPLTVDYLSNNGGYLVTHDKLRYGSEASNLFEVPFYLIVNLLLENKILIWKVTDDQGLFLFDFETKNTSTKMTCNGGTIVRPNSYLPVDKATIIEYEQ